MTLYRRLTMVVILAAAFAVGATSVVALLLFEWRMREGVDQSLRARADQVLGQQPLDRPVEFVPTEAGSVAGLGFFQDLVTTDPPRDARLPDVTLDVASGRQPEALFDRELDGLPLRFYARQVQPGLALVVGRRVDDLNATLAGLRWLASGVAAGGLLLALLSGATVARRALTPLSRLARAVEAAAERRDLAHRVPVERGDELGRLARSVNQLLEALDGVERSRQQLIADASHELRSPLASLRTNVEVLARAGDLPPEEREPLLRDVLTQTGELTALVDDLLALARDRPPETSAELVRVDVVVERALLRVRPRARARQVRILAQLSGHTVLGVADDLERAVANLLDNAVKWSPPGGTVAVTLTAEGELHVRDEGPGIRAEDRPFVFDRFYRARDARSMLGSGLGLAIVRKVVEEHGGHIAVDGAADGHGTVMVVSLPAADDHPHGR